MYTYVYIHIYVHNVISITIVEGRESGYFVGTTPDET